MNKKKLHLHKYIFFYTFAFLLFVLITIFMIKFLHDFYEIKKLKTDYSIYKDRIEEAYNIDSSLFVFDDNNTAIIKVDALLNKISNDKESMEGIGIIPQTKEQDQCVGYIVVKKNKNNTLDIDTSHMCDMIDY